MKKHFFFLLLAFSSILSAQNAGPDPRIIFPGDNGYNPVTIRNPTLIGDNIGRIQFSGWLSPVEKWYAGAEIKSVVSGQPGASYMPTDLGFFTGGTTLQERMRMLENGNIGINHSSPTARLSVLDMGNPNKTIFEAIGGSAGSVQKKFQISNSANGLLHTYLQGSMEVESGNVIVKEGNVGVGNLTPAAKMSIVEYGNSGKTIFEAIGGNNTGSQKRFRVNTATDGLLNTFLQGSMEVEGGNMVVKNGKLGIGVEPNDMPGDHKLYVNGSAISTKMIVELKVNWPDYVFSNDYKLMPLKVLEAYIHKESHLPGVPSAEEVGKNGLDLGEMQRITMESIEKLTLYIIQQQKEIDALKERLEKVESKSN